MTTSLTIYGKPVCPQCTASVRKADQLGLTYTYVDVSTDPAALAQLKAEGFGGVPVVKVGDRSWTGYRPDLLSKEVKTV